MDDHRLHVGDDCRRRGEHDHHQHAAEILTHSKGGQELRPLAGPPRIQLGVHFSSQISPGAEAFVRPGKANGCGLPHTEDAPRPILPCAAPAGVTREPAVLVFALPSMRTFVCLIVEPAQLRGAKFFPPCLVPPSFPGKSCVPADQSAVSPHPFPDDRAATRLAWPLAGADPSTRFVQREVWPQVAEPHPILQLRQVAEQTPPASPDRRIGARDASAGAELPSLPPLFPCHLDRSAAELPSLPSPFPCHLDQNAAELPPWPPPCPCHLDQNAAELPPWPSPFPCHPDRSAAERRDLRFLLLLQHLLLVKPPTRQIPASHLPGSNTSGHPSKANESAAWRPGRAPLPAPANATPPGREKSQSRRSKRRRPTAGTSIPATKARSPGRCRQP
jgi:hypothetical protein